MATIPTQQQLMKTLLDAGRAHHEFQTNFLEGVRHEGWAWWYAAYVLGRLGDFTTPTLLTRWLEEVEAERAKWFNQAAEYVLLKINAD